MRSEPGVQKKKSVLQLQVMGGQHIAMGVGETA